MSSRHYHQDIDVFAGQRSSTKSSRHGSIRSRSSSDKKPKMRRQYRVSSGYGSASETCNSYESMGKRSSTKYSHQPPTFDELSSRYESDPERLYESIPERTSETGTVIQTDERVSAVRFSKRYHAFSAPDMLLDGATKGIEPFSAVINGQRVDYTSMPVLTPLDGQLHLIRHAEKRFKLPTKVARKCVVKNTEYEVAFRFTLLTLIEWRTMENQTKPYHGQKLPRYSPRSAWDCEIRDKPTHFYDAEEHYKVPGSEKIITCKLCDGNGKGKCNSCNGAGQKTCTRCHGFGKEPMSNTECMQCGDGFETCLECHGGGVGKCVECEGRGKVVSYQRLKVKWIVKKHIYVDAINGVPKKQLKEAEGRRIHRECCEGRVEPITEKQLFHSRIVDESMRQTARFRDIRGTVCRQSQTVDLVLAQRFDCQYKDKPFSFHVIGNDRTVYAPDYPNRRFKCLDFFSRKD